MKLSNKFFRITLAILASLAIMLSLGACSCEGCDGDGTTAPETLPPGGITLTSILFSDDMPVEFVAIRAYSASSTVAAASADFIATIEMNTGAEIELSNDRDSNTPKRFEILIGETDRSESKGAMGQVAEDEYLIKVIGYKLVIVGGSEEALVEGINKFLSTHVKGKLRVDLPLDFSMKGSIN